MWRVTLEIKANANLSSTCTVARKFALESIPALSFLAERNGWGGGLEVKGRPKMTFRGSACAELAAVALLHRGVPRRAVEPGLTTSAWHTMPGQGLRSSGVGVDARTDRERPTDANCLMPCAPRCTAIWTTAPSPATSRRSNHSNAY